MISINNSGYPQIEKSDVLGLESHFNLSLPSDYVQFLLDYNGGRPEPNYLIIPDLGVEVVLGDFLGIGVEHYDLTKLIHKMMDDMPKAHLPIGFDPGGNVYFIDSTNGEVFYWDAGRHFAESTDEENAYKVADSFTDLLNSLYRDSIC